MRFRGRGLGFKGFRGFKGLGFTGFRLYEVVTLGLQ